MTIRVFLLDDHALVRTGFRMILGAEDDIEIVGEAASGEEALPAIRALRPDVVLCDLHLPGVSGLEVTERLVRGPHPTRVVIVSVQENGPLPRRLLEAGACGYIGKGGDAAELLQAVRHAAAGRRYLGGDMAQRLALESLEGMASPFDQLTVRELEVAILLSQGRRMEDIATRLCVSAKTVATHKYRLLDKLDVHDTVSLAHLAARHGLLERETL